MSIRRLSSDVHDRHGEHEALQRREVRCDQRLDRIGADAGPGEHLLDQHIGAEQEREHHAERGDDRDHGVAEGVGDDHGRRRQPAGARGAHEVGGQHRQHRGAGHARDRREREDRERQRRQDELLEARHEHFAVAGDQAVDQVEAGDLRRRAEEDVEPPERRRRDAQQVIEDVDQDQPGEEHRQRHAGGRDHAAGMVDERSRFGRGEDAERHRDQHRDDQAEQRQLGRGRQARCGCRSRPAGRW